MKIPSADQIRKLDSQTLTAQHISSWELMERASKTFVDWFTEKIPNEDLPVRIYAGIGNNGGDGLAIARMLHQRFYNIQVFICKISESTSEDFEVNYQKIKDAAVPDYTDLDKSSIDEHSVVDGGIIIDAIFGSGLNRPIEAPWSTLIEKINSSKATKIAVDIPSGIFADKSSKGCTALLADHTLGFELPKLAFMMPENEAAVGEWEVRTIGLDKPSMSKMSSSNMYTDYSDAAKLKKDRTRFGHKGTYGHALLVCGSKGKVGAAVLSARACLSSGAGKVSVHTPVCGYQILQISVPEAMVNTDEHQICTTGIGYNTDEFQAIGIGCGIGTNALTVSAIEMLLRKTQKPMVLDADALNILSISPRLLSLIPANSILTPHPGEFRRLFGDSSNDFDRLELLRQKSQELNVIILLKGANTAIASPDGKVYFNSTGNPGMATAGSGDVLTGIITALLAQGYLPKDAAVLAAYVHGLSADLAIEISQSPESLIASDIINNLGIAFSELC